MRSVGSGVFEIRASTQGRAFRTFYVTKLDDAIYVLHAFEKKTQKTSRSDIETGQARYKALTKQLS